LNIFTYASMSAFFIYAYLTIPIHEFGNAHTDPEFVTIGDTVEVTLPLVKARFWYEKLQAVEAVPLIIDSDSLFWDNRVLDIKYELVPKKQSGLWEIISYGTSSAGDWALSSKTYRIERGGVDGERLIKFIVPDDMRLTGKRLI